MSVMRATAVALLCGFTVAATAQVDTVATQTELARRADEARSQRLLDKAVAHYQTHGARAFDDFNRSAEFVDRELYVYVIDLNGRMLASGGSSVALVGREVLAMRDAAGKPFFRELLDKAATESSGRVEYRWLNWLDKRETPKVTLFQRVGDRVLAVGYYVPRGSAEQARELLERAVAAVATRGESAVTDFNAIDGGFIQDDLYVFAVDIPSRRFLAHGVMPQLVGRDGRDLRDPKGKPIILDMLNIVERKGAGELDYAWRNPVTGKVESKHTFLRKVGDVMIGVGYYAR